MANRYINATLRFYDKFTQPLQQATQKVKQTTEGLSAHHKEFTRIGNELTKTGRGMQKTGMSLTKTVTAPVVGIVGASMRAGMAFDQQMSKVSAISGATGKELTSLREKAKHMGATTKFSATEAAQALEYMGMAGWKASDMKAGLEGVMNLAAASGEDLARVSDIVTDGLTAFKMGADESNHFADVLAKTATSANTDVGKMGETFKYVAPLAGTLGYSIEDMGKAIGLMASGNVKASQAGTALRTGLSNMASGKYDKQMEKYGISVKDAEGNMKSMQQVMETMRDKFGKLSKAEQVAGVTAIVGKNAQAGWLNIINASEKDFKKLTKQIDNSEGSAAKMAKVMLDNGAGAATILKSSLESAAIAINDRLAPYVVKVIEFFQKWVDKFNSLSKENQDFIVKAALMAAAVGPLLTVGGKFLMTYGNIFKQLGKIGKAFDKAGGASSFFAQKMEFATKRMKPSYWTNLGNSIKTGFTGAISGASARMGALATRFPMLGRMGRFFANPWTLAIAGVGVGLVALYKKNEDFRNGVNKAWAGMKKALAPSVKAMMSELAKLGEAMKPVIKIAGKEIGKAMKTLAKSMEPVFRNAAPLLVKGIRLIGMVVRTVAPILGKVLVAAITIGIKVLTKIIQVVRKLSPIFTTVFSAVVKVVSAIAAPIAQVINGIIKIFSGVIDFITGVFTGNWSKAWEGVKNIFKGIFSTFGGIVKAPLNAVISAVNAVIGGLNKIHISVPDWVPGFGGKSWGFNISKIPQLAKGTAYHSGGPALVGEKGPEIVNIPRGSQVYSNSESKKMMSGKSIVVNKLADKIVVREEADIDKIATALARKLETTEPNVMAI